MCVDCAALHCFGGIAGLICKRDVLVQLVCSDRVKALCAAFISVLCFSCHGLLRSRRFGNDGRYTRAGILPVSAAGNGQQLPYRSKEAARRFTTYICVGHGSQGNSLIISVADLTQVGLQAFRW